ncbi:hypothetical protein Vretimale_14246 [Volvox reticuliferus]|uniref:Protein ENHANCED DISEASE RESISTANCE 2 C-terminal domain-containing protein n=1 Tax=Volvox reticuliferus TaxID=1737510 RepID=A0A8J4GNB4_9CHLO|nr:hypothetical protein Vretimale_14246 [Volvox reticuliferus]
MGNFNIISVLGEDNAGVNLSSLPAHVHSCLIYTIMTIKSDLSSGFHFAKIQQPAWGHSDSMHANREPLVEGVVYKLTRIPGVVVQRGAALFKDRCVTYHDLFKKTDATTWMLDRSCALLPGNASELVSKRRGIRPKGTWAITAAVQGVEAHVDVFEIKIDWPSSWAASGYTDLVLGFTDRSEAESWHSALGQVLAELGGGAEKGGKGQHSRSTSAKEPSDLITTSAPVADTKTDIASTSAVSAPPTSQMVASSQSTPQMVSLDGLAKVAMTAAAEAASDGPDRMATAALDDDNSNDTDEEADEDDSPTPDGERWVPYRQTNGVAIYYHAGEGQKSGDGEYMVSCVIRGHPHRVAAALMRLKGNTTILGPAEHVEMLQTAEERTGVKQEVLRLVMTASGNAGWFCAPREVILERMRKEVEDGVIVILFKSVHLPNEADAKGTNNLYGTGLYKRPIRATVAGGYTIAGLKGEGSSSPESLITCIVKVDLGGVCSSSSWARRFASTVGWVDSFLDRILMSVHLLRDEVEQRRFMVQPFKLVSSVKARFNEDGMVVNEAASSPGAGPKLSAPSLTRAPRLTARMASVRVSANEPVTLVAAAVSTTIPEDGAVGSIDTSSMLLDLARVQSLIKLPRKYWCEVQVPGTDAPFHVRGPTYLKDKKKILAGAPAFNLGGVELIELPPPGTLVAGQPSTTGVVPHICRFLPSVREGGAPFSIVICLVIPGAPMLTLTSVFCCDKHPSILGTPPARPMDEEHNWQPFDFVLHKFVYGSDETRNKILKLVPHIANGSWMIKQSVGTTPVIIGKALKTTYHCTPTYIEVNIDISANSVANYVTGMVRGATTSLDIDLAFVLEGTAPWELPECLLGAFRLTRLDCNAATPLDWSRALPLISGQKETNSKL